MTDRLVQDAASRGKYAPLYRHLASRVGSTWRVSFSELETILGFELPASARLCRSWWSPAPNTAWHAAGWRTRAVNLEAETLVFERSGHRPVRIAAPSTIGKFDLDEIWPAIPGGSWPPGFTVGRDQIYDGSGRLTGGPQDEPANGN